MIPTRFVAHVTDRCIQTGENYRHNLFARKKQVKIFFGKSFSLKQVLTSN